MTCSIVTDCFEPLEQVIRFQKGCGFNKGQIGASAVFVGTMRDFNDGIEVESMFLEHYPDMAEKVLNEIRKEAIKRWHLNEVLIIHRVGRIFPGEAIVLVATWSGHRAHAFESCRHMMEILKSRAPFWKKERSKEGERWVSKNTEGKTDL